jgi:hypothetical protein
VREKLKRKMNEINYMHSEIRMHCDLTVFAYTVISFNPCTDPISDH